MEMIINISESDIIDKNEYADWFCSRLYWKRLGEVEYSKCDIKDDESGRLGSFEIDSLTVEWDDGEETDVEDEIKVSGYSLADVCDDFDCSAIMCGETTDGGEPDMVFFGVD